jgi:hypothetical protein
VLSEAVASAKIAVTARIKPRASAMATSSKIKVMISSRRNDPFPLASKPAVRLSEIRRQIKKTIEAEKLLGETPYEVWINEDAVADSSRDS